MTITTRKSEQNELAHELSQNISGEVRFDDMSRALWSTDASIYQIKPVGVVLPRSEEDIIATLELASKNDVTILPRGGGTSLAGQTVGNSVIVDFSKYMRNVVELNLDEGWVKTQPGIILDELNRYLAPHNVMFTPDPSTSNRGNVGGALGNNSCGAHSIMWGKTVDNVVDLDIILSNGDTANFGQVSGDQLETKMRLSSFDGDIYRNLFRIGEENRTEILERYPKIQRRVSGYNLDEFVGGSNFNMARFVVGSEGTLITINEAKLKVTKIPKVTGLLVLHCMDLIESMEATVAAIEMEPSAIELIGSMILRQAKANLAYSRMTDFIDGDTEAILAIELIAETNGELDSKFHRLEERISRGGWGYSMIRMTKAADQQKVWDVRKAGLGLMMNVPGDAKPLPFVEDTAVSPEVLPEFVRRFDSIIKKHGTEAGYYGHASVGCLHIRPLINPKTEVGINRMKAISDEISDLVLEFGGALSGEHGDGLVRSGYNEKMFGKQIYQAFKDVKKTFDPNTLMNPGKIVNSPPMTENLRFGTAYNTEKTLSGFSFLPEGGTFASAVEMCNGQGACRKITNGVMCPSYMATRDEEHSTRGRANALRAAISGAIPFETFTSDRMYQVMDLCLECKGCKAECPSNVDMAKIKYDFLYNYHQKNGLTLKNRFFGNVALLSKIGSFFSPISNWLLHKDFSKALLEKMIKIDPRRDMPTFASQTFVQWFRSRTNHDLIPDSRGKVLLFPDTTTNYNNPNLGISAVHLIEKLGYEVIVPDFKCCGRPYLSNGMMQKAKDNANFNVALIQDYVESGAKLVGIEPSCILGIKEDFIDLLDDPNSGKKISKNTMLIEEFVSYAFEQSTEIEFKKDIPFENVALFGHCHQKAMIGTSPAINILNRIPGITAKEIQSGCCGMAGSFGYTKDHYDISMDIGRERLFPAIKDLPNNTVIASEGFSCREQILHGTGQSALHLVEILDKSIDG